MEFDQQSIVAFSRTWGLFCLIVLSIGVLAYVFWPSNRKRFRDAKRSILDKNDRPKKDGG